MHRRLSDALDALLYRRADREAFLAGDVSRFELSAEDSDALRAIDPEQLISAARLAREHVFLRTHRGVGSLLSAFRETIDAWRTSAARRDVDPDELASAFVGSPHFEAYRTVPYAGRGTSLEEAFYRFAEDADVGEHPVRFRECVTALLRGLSQTPDPVFVLPSFVRRAPGGYFAVDETGPALFAILQGRFVAGPITPYIAAVLSGDPLPGERLPCEDERAAIHEELSRLGLVEPRVG